MRLGMKFTPGHIRVLRVRGYTKVCLTGTFVHRGCGPGDSLFPAWGRSGRCNPAPSCPHHDGRGGPESEKFPGSARVVPACNWRPFRPSGRPSRRTSGRFDEKTIRRLDDKVLHDKKISSLTITIADNDDDCVLIKKPRTQQRSAIWTFF